MHLYTVYEAVVEGFKQFTAWPPRGLIAENDSRDNARQGIDHSSHLVNARKTGSTSVAVSSGKIGTVKNEESDAIHDGTEH